MYLYDAFLKISPVKTREEFNFWTAKNFIRLSADTKPSLDDIITINPLVRKYKVIGFSSHKPNNFEPVIDVIKLKLLA